MKKLISALLILALSVALLIPFGIVTVSADEPTLITDQAGLAAMSATGSYKLGSDVTISGEWRYTTPFKGAFDGDGHTITFADGATVIGGLFKQLNQGATIKNLNIVAGDNVTWKPVADAEGSGSPCVGGLAASAEAGFVNGSGKWGDTAFVSDPANMIKIQNVTVTATIAVSGVVARSGKDEDKVAGGGIIGEIGIISLIKDCTFNGSLSDQNRGKIDKHAYESGYGGIVGVAIRNGGPVAIIGCVNNGDITGYGQSGGILGYSRHWGDDVGIQTVHIEKCINNGKITCMQTDFGTDGNPKRAAAGGIAGYLYPKDGATVDLLYNVNYGVVEAADTNKNMTAGICGILRQKETVTLEGNVNLYGSAKGQLIREGTSNGKINYLNNYSIAGDDLAKYTALDSAKAIYDALSAIYPDVYSYDTETGKIGLADSTSGSSSLNVPQTMTMYVTVPEPTGTAITNQKELEAMTADGTYYLANDIEIKGTFKSIADFSGVLHGNEHTVVFNGAELRGGFFKNLAGGKIYNISFTEASGSSGKNSYRGLLSANEVDLCFGIVAGYGYGTIVNVTSACDVGSSLKRTSNAYVGGVIGIVTDGETVLYNCYNTGKVQGGYAGGIAGAIFCEEGKVEIVRCVNWAEVVSSSGAAGGVFAIHTLKSLQVAMNLLVLENVNYGAVSTTESSYCGGIAGSVGCVVEGKASFLRNINYGTIKANAADLGCPGGIIGYIGYDGILIAGNVNSGNVEGTKSPNRLVAAVVGSGAVVSENNFATEGTAPATVGVIAGVAVDENTVATLNAAYSNAYVSGADGKIALKWASDTGLSEAAPTVSYTVAGEPEEESPSGEQENNNPGTSEPVTQAPTTETETKKGGCGSAIGIGGLVAMLMLGGAGVMVATRRKED